MLKRNTKMLVYKLKNKIFPNTSKHKRKKLIRRKKTIWFSNKI